MNLVNVYPLASPFESKEVGAPTDGTLGEPDMVKSISPNVSNFKLESTLDCIC